MTRTRSNRGRHRRNRDRPADATPESDTPEAVSAEAVAQAPASPAPVQRPRGPEQRPPGREQAQTRRPPDAQRLPQERSPGGPRGQQPGTTDQARGNRRRPPRRPQPAPMPNQVLKTKAPITGPQGPVTKRRLEDISGPEGPALGCPMLTRTRIGLPVTGGQRAPRCSLAWAIHSETEASFCMETLDAAQCWKAHPERLDDVKARLEERRAAD